ncbi:MAG: MFS transporter [Mycobacterium sp.]|nr:MFS transporter [Mycobacterium sp.]
MSLRVREASASNNSAYEVAELPGPETPEGKRLLRKAIAAAVMGNATEWYDYGVYATVATYLADAFFPGPLCSIGAMLGFAVSFVLRPLGGMVWGPIGDRIGRTPVLAATILLISGATTLIGVLPTYGTAGVWAPVMLIFLRVAQGFSTGGEYGGAATVMAEYAPDDKRARYGSFLEFGTLCGFAFGTSIVLVMEAVFTNRQMADWGWRIPFFVALPLGLVGVFLRTRVGTTPVFKECENQHEITGSPWTRFVDLLSHYRRPLSVMFAMVVALNIADYTLLTYLPTYLHLAIGLSDEHRTTVILIGQLAMMACIPFLGRLSDRVGRKPMWWASLIGLFVLAVPMFWLMAQGVAWAIVGFVVLGMLFIPQLASVSATFAAMFPTQVRYSGFSFSYNVATAAFGGTAPLISDAVVKGTGWHLFPAVYMMLACAVGMAAMPFLRETAGCSIRGTEIPGYQESEARAA